VSQFCHCLQECVTERLLLSTCAFEFVGCIYALLYLCATQPEEQPVVPVRMTPSDLNSIQKRLECLQESVGLNVPSSAQQESSPGKRPVAVCDATPVFGELVRRGCLCVAVTRFRPSLIGVAHAARLEALGGTVGAFSAACVEEDMKGLSAAEEAKLHEEVAALSLEAVQQASSEHIQAWSRLGGQDDSDMRRALACKLGIRAANAVRRSVTQLRSAPQYDNHRPTCLPSYLDMAPPPSFFPTNTLASRAEDEVATVEPMTIPSSTSPATALAPAVDEGGSPGASFGASAACANLDAPNSANGDFGATGVGVDVGVGTMAATRDESQEVLRPGELPLLNVASDASRTATTAPVRSRPVATRAVASTSIGTGDAARVEAFNNPSTSFVALVQPHSVPSPPRQQPHTLFTPASSSRRRAPSVRTSHATRRSPSVHRHQRRSSPPRKRAGHPSPSFEAIDVDAQLSTSAETRNRPPATALASGGAAGTVLPQAPPAVGLSVVASSTTTEPDGAVVPGPMEHLPAPATLVGPHGSAAEVPEKRKKKRKKKKKKKKKVQCRSDLVRQALEEDTTLLDQIMATVAAAEKEL